MEKSGVCRCNLGAHVQGQKREWYTWRCCFAGCTDICRAANLVPVYAREIAATLQYPLARHLHLALLRGPRGNVFLSHASAAEMSAFRRPRHPGLLACATPEEGGRPRAWITIKNRTKPKVARV